VLPREEVRLGAVPALLGRYRSYLISERGLTPGTARCYLDAIRPFVTSRLRGEELNLAGLTAGDVTAFVVAACPGRPQGTAKLIVTTLRSLLTWLHVEGVIATSLADAVPAVAGWRLTGLPRGLEPEQLRWLLASCDRRRRVGRRDYAILLLLSRLGLRAGEVAALGLDDLDWRSGELVIRGKANRSERLPLPADVGSAMTAYLRHGRPATAQGRSLFVRAKAPHRPLTTAGVSMVVHDAAQHAGLGTVHAHRLRHTAATRMLRAGTPLTEVGLVLRQRRALTTALYAKLDRDALRVHAGGGRGRADDKAELAEPSGMLITWNSSKLNCFTDGGNNAVVRMPSRRFPGVVIQGDTLSNLWSIASDALEQQRAGRIDVSLDQLEMIVDDLNDMLRRYETALDRAGLPRPYNLPSRP
jgi:integrase/recombinase XerD